MRTDSLLLALILLIVFEGVIPAQGRGAPESGGASALATEAAHLKLKPAEWRSLDERHIVTRSLAGGQPKEIAGFGAMIADASPEEFVKAFNALSVFKNSETTSPS